MKSPSRYNQALKNGSVHLFFLSPSRILDLKKGRMVRRLNLKILYLLCISFMLKNTFCFSLFLNVQTERGADEYNLMNKRNCKQTKTWNLFINNLAIYTKNVYRSFRKQLLFLVIQIHQLISFSAWLIVSQDAYIAYNQHVHKQGQVIH